MHWKTRQKLEKQAGETALILLTIVDGMVAMTFGPNAAMNKAERDMIAEPLERILVRSGLTQIKAAKEWMDPILLVMGLTAWGSRVWRQQRTKVSQEKPKEPKPEPKETEGETEPERETTYADLGEATAVPLQIAGLISEV